MSDRLPYEEQLAQQWNDLPVPDENMAWEDMKYRLEKDHDDRIIPVWLRGCGLWGLLAVVLLGLGWWLMRPDKWGNQKQDTETVVTVGEKENTGDIENNINTDDSTPVIKSKVGEKATGEVKDVSKLSSADSSLTSLHTRKKNSLLKKEQNLSVQVTSAQSKKKETGSKQQKGKRIIEKNKNPNNKKAQKQTENEQVDISIQPGIKNKETGNEPVETKDKPFITISDSLSVTKVNSSNLDSIPKISPDSIQKKTELSTVKANEQKKDSSKPKTTSFSAGVALHQLLPIDGQKFTPYNSLGRKGSLADYIPSVYGRMYRNDKWFLQLEFRYGAPQYTKDLLYSQQSSLDTIGANNHTIITSYTLKKTFYHQLPVTFNYFVLPDWSAGGGFAWNKFYSGITERDINRRNNTTQADSVFSKTIITTRNDTSSVFAKSYFQLLFETQYRWRRFSFGAKYSFGLQPYIKFSLGGTIQREERNRSFQIFLRYELWKSKAKSPKEKRR
ncbi:MAG: hypothetical protein WDO71_10380 [Bacteroidota bacterium]